MLQNPEPILHIFAPVPEKDLYFPEAITQSFYDFFVWSFPVLPGIPGLSLPTGRLPLPQSWNRALVPGH